MQLVTKMPPAQTQQRHLVEELSTGRPRIWAVLGWVKTQQIWDQEVLQVDKLPSLGAIRQNILQQMLAMLQWERKQVK